MHNRASALCRQVGTPEQQISVLHEPCSSYDSRGETTRHHALAGRLVDMAEQLRSPVHLVTAGMHLGNAHYMRGKLALAQEQFERCISLYTPQQHRAHIATTGADRGVF